MKTDSPQKRYIVTFFVNIFELLGGVLNSTILPRALSTSNYGNYNFITSVGSSFQGFFNMQTSNAFYTYSSEHLKSGASFYLYYLWMILQLIVFMVFIWLAAPFNYFRYIFPGQELIYVFVVVGSLWLNSFSLSLIQFGESKAETIFVQKVKLARNLIKSFLYISLFALGLLSFNNFLGILYTTSLITALWIIFFFLIPNRDRYIGITSFKEIKNNIIYFKNYCKPLFIFEWFCFIYYFFYRWFLQKVSGSVEQAYFSIAQQWSLVSFIFATSVLNIFWREVSFAFSQGNIERARRICLKTLDFVYFTCSFISLFIIFNARIMLNLFVGKRYNDATIVVSLMAFYSIYYTLGQIINTYMYATSQVTLFKNLSIFNTIWGFVFIYFFLAPKSFIIPGLGMGAKGLALATLIPGTILANNNAYFSFKKINLGISRFLIKQILVLIILSLLLGIATLCARVTNLSNLPYLIINFTTYSLLVITLIYIKPNVMGISVLERNEYKQKIINKFQSIFKV